MGKLRTEKQTLEIMKKHTPRIGFRGLHYFEICRDACTLIKKCNSELDKLRKLKPKPVKKDGKVQLKRNSQDEMLLLNKIHKQESVAIAFAAMCLEACIWDYAACCTSQKKTKENFESLNLVAKWVIIPQILCNSDITKTRIGDTNYLGRLRKLKDARNDLVHSKSHPLPNNVKTVIEMIMSSKKRIAVEDTFDLIVLLLGELEKVDKSDWWFFKHDTYKDVIKKSR